MDLIKKAIRNIQQANDELVPAPEAVLVAKQIRQVEDAFYVGLVGAEHIAMLTQCSNDVLDGLNRARLSGRKISVKFVRSMESLIEELAGSVVDPVEQSCLEFLSSSIRSILPSQVGAIDTSDKALTYLRAANGAIGKLLDFIALPAAQSLLSDLLVEDVDFSAANHLSFIPSYTASLSAAADQALTLSFSKALEVAGSEDRDFADLEGSSAEGAARWL